MPKEKPKSSLLFYGAAQVLRDNKEEIIDSALDYIRNKNKKGKDKK